METLILKTSSGVNALTRRISRLAGMACLTLLGGCGAMWDAVYPPQDPREDLTFHLASLTPYADWTLRTGPLGDPQIYVQPSALFSGASIEMAAPMVDASKQYFVGVRLEPVAARRLAGATQAPKQVSSIVRKPALPGQLIVSASDVRLAYIALLQRSQLVSVMPVDQPIPGGTFAIPVNDAAAAQALSNAFNVRPD